MRLQCSRPISPTSLFVASSHDSEASATVLGSDYYSCADQSSQPTGISMKSSSPGNCLSPGAVLTINIFMMYPNLKIFFTNKTLKVSHFIQPKQRVLRILMMRRKTICLCFREIQKVLCVLTLYHVDIFSIFWHNELRI